MNTEVGETFAIGPPLPDRTRRERIVHSKWAAADLSSLIHDFVVRTRISNQDEVSMARCSEGRTCDEVPELFRGPKNVVVAVRHENPDVVMAHGSMPIESWQAPRHLGA